MSNLLNSFMTEFRRGTLTLAVLSQLRTPQYGYSLVQLLEHSGIYIDQSTLYPFYADWRSRSWLQAAGTLLRAGPGNITS